MISEAAGGNQEEPVNTVGRALTDREKEWFIHQSRIERENADPSDPRVQHVLRHRKAYEDAGGREIVAELQGLGYDVDSVGELGTLGATYRSAVPVLIDWLGKVSYADLVEDIIHTLSVPWARELVLPVFLRMFRDPPIVSSPLRPTDPEFQREQVRWAIGNGLEVFAASDIAEEILELAQAQEYGEARMMIVLAMSKIGGDRAPDVLMDLLDDDTVSPHAIEALGKLKYAPARERIAAMLNHAENVRDQSKKALRRIDKAVARTESSGK